jgi:uncharacterized damage-inducible protein DinB
MANRVVQCPFLRLNKKKMKNVFLLGLSFVLLNGTFAQQDSMQVQLARKWSNAKTYTITVAELMPEEKYEYKPVVDEMSFKKQLLHIMDNINWLTSTHLTKEKYKVKTDSASTKTDIIKEMKLIYDYAEKAILNFPTKDLDESVQFFAGPMTKRQILFLLQDHQTHHRAQLLVYLRLNGITPPKYVGW